MKIVCLHGYFMFEPESPYEVSLFNSVYKAGFVRSGEYFTFEGLADADSYSLEGKSYLGATATKTFQGYPWQVMRANNLVFDFTSGLLVNPSSVVRSVTVKQTNFRNFESGLFVPGSLSQYGRILSYSGSGDGLRFLYDWIEYG